MAYGSVAPKLRLHLKYFHRLKLKLQREVELKEMTKLFLSVPSYNLSELIHTTINSGHLNCKDDIIFEPSGNTRNISIPKTPQLKLKERQKKKMFKGDVESYILSVRNKIQQTDKSVRQEIILMYLHFDIISSL